MNYLLWSLPMLVIAGAIAIARLNATQAAALGLLATVPVAIYAGDTAFGGAQLALALERGAWIGATIAPYILGGLLFWQAAAHGASAPADGGAASPADARDRRRLLFFACFLVGPYAEAATGFGVGMLGTVALLRGQRIAPRHLMVFALLSQTLIPWGAMSSGTLLASAYARMTGTELALYAMVPTAALMALVWLPLYWRTASRAGFDPHSGGKTPERLREAGWIAAALALLAAFTAWLGPETALLASYGPLITLRYLLDRRPDRRAFAATARRMLPYAALIAALALTRLVPEWRAALAAVGRVAPYADLPAWSPLLHAGSWLIAAGVLTAALRGQAARLSSEARAAWTTGRHAVMTVFLFAMMAEILAAAGISQAFARGMFDALGQGAVVVAPLFSAAFGVLTNSGNMPNSLFMPAQTAIAVQAGLSVPAVAALQHVSGTAMSLFSPVRMSIAANLAEGRGEERKVYAALLPCALAALALLLLMALAIALSPRH